MAKPKALRSLISKRRKNGNDLEASSGLKQSLHVKLSVQGQQAGSPQSMSRLLSLAGLLAVSLVVLERDILGEFSATPGSNIKNVSGHTE